MARLWSCGYELQSATVGVEYTSGNGVATAIVTTPVRGGAAACRVNPAAASAWHGQIFKAAASTTQTYARVAIYVTALPAVTTEVMGFWNSGGGRSLSLRITPTGAFELYDSGGITRGISATVGTGSYNVIEMSCGNAVGGARLNGTEFVVDGTAMTTGAFDALYLGTPSGAGTYDVTFDDIAINDTSGSAQASWPGLGKIVHLRPNAPGDFAQGARGGADSGSDWGQIDEITPNDATDYYRLDNDGDILDLRLPTSWPTPTAWDTVTLVQVGVRQRESAAAASTLVLRIKSQAGGTVASSAALALSDTTWRTNGQAAPRNYALTSYTDPQLGGSWSPSLLTATQIGAQAPDATPPVDVSTIWLLVEYLTGTAPPPAPAVTYPVYGVPQAQYQVILYSTAGNQLRTIVDWQALSYQRVVNAPGKWSITIAESSQIGVPISTLPALFTEDAIVQIKRRIPGVIDWYTDFTGFVRDIAWATDEAGNRSFTAAGLDCMDLLARRTIAYNAGTKQTEKSGVAGTVMAEFVTENAGSGATTGNGRKANGQTTGLTVTTAAIGSTWQGSRFQDNLLAVLQGISTQVGDVEWTFTTTVGSGSVSFVFAIVARVGTDKSATVTFSKARGNVGAPRYSLARKAARNRGYGLGQGDLADRVTVTVNDATLQAASPWAISEVRRDATQQITASAITAAVTETLEAMKPFEQVQFTPIETPTSQYGVTYDLGDTVTTIIDDETSRTLRIIGITVGVAGGDSGVESIAFDVTVLR